MTDGGQDNELAALEKVLLDQSADPVDLPFSLLKAITGNFSEDNEIGSGGFGAVYKGVLPSGHTIAVKKLFERFEILDKNFASEIPRILLRNATRDEAVRGEACLGRRAAEVALLRVPTQRVPCWLSLR